MTRKEEDAITVGATLETAVLFFSLALAVNLAVYGWLGALGVWSSKEANRLERLVYLFIAGTFTVLAVGLGTPSLSWFARSDRARPRGPCVR